MRKAEWEYINNTITQGLQTNNSKPFWKYIKSRKQDNIGVAPLKKNGSLVCDSKEKAEILLDQFQSVFTRDGGSAPPHLDPPQHPIISDININTAGVCKLLKAINPHKVCGPDQIPNVILKNCADTLAPALRDIFQRSLDTSVLPSDWRTANVSAVFKKGDKHLPENYRPISLTSVPCKIVEHIIYRHLMTYLEEHNILTDLNHGFRAGFSCETQLLTTNHDLFSSFDTGTQTDMAVLDFSKAFDTVPHSKLLKKLSHYGIGGTILEWLKKFLTGRTMKVVFDGKMSREIPVDSGVPQGAVLGPLLFLCHINDLPTSVKSQVRLFADDCLLYRKIQTFNDHILLQKDLTQLGKWANTWGMNFNTNKCHIISINNKTKFFYSLNNETLEYVTTNPYLGITISNDLKWHSHISKITKKANSTLGFLRRNIRRCPINSKRTAYIALVRAVLEYRAILWDPYHRGDIDKLEQIQHRAARFITGDYRSRHPGSVTTLLTNLNLDTLDNRRRDQRLKFMYRTDRGYIPALPTDTFFRPQKTNKRHIKPKHFPDHVSSNFVQQLTTNNTRCFIVPTAYTEQFKNSFFCKNNSRLEPTKRVAGPGWNHNWFQSPDLRLKHSITCAHTPVIYNSHYWLLYDVSHSDSDSDSDAL